MHFSLPKEEYHICTQKGLSQRSKNQGKTWSPALVSLERSYLLLPEYSLLSAQKRSTVLFVQLLDMAKRDNYQATLRCKYALNLLLLEFSAEAQTADSLTNDRTPRKVRELIEWIRAHYDEPLTVSSLAEQFHYHPTYLTALFKKHTGYSVSAYISYIRIESAKNILCSTDTLSVREAAYLCGFDDEKYFMRLFKKLEGVTPSQYRNAFFEKKVNRR